MRKIKGVLTVKRFLAVLLMMFAVLPSNSAYSKIIRDAELGQPCEFEDTAEVRLLDFSFVNEIGATDYYKITCQKDQEIALLKAEITNLSTEVIMFSMGEKYPYCRVVSLDVTVLYRDKIPFNGTASQYSDEKPGLLMWHSYTEEYKSYGSPSLLNITPPSVVRVPTFVAVDKMYTRNFAFFCKLPKRVVNDKKSPLQMIIRIGDDELTYSIRK